METTLKDLLEDFDKALPLSITHNELLKTHSQSLIENAVASDILHRDYTGGKDPAFYNLTGFGLSLLTQIRTKKSINELDKSIKEFNKSSGKWSCILTIIGGIMLIVASFQIYLILFYG